MINHRPIILTNIGLTFPHKTCFKNFSAQIMPGKHIAIIGRNGSGKTSLLKIVQGLIEPTQGSMTIPSDIVFGYIPQTVQNFDELSGGQRFNRALTQALATQPNVLCLDEPTNHLDAHNKQSLLRMLKHYKGTTIIVSHDPELLRTCTNEFWHINDDGTIQLFTGTYDDYLVQQKGVFASKAKQLEELKKEYSKLQKSAQKEQKRAAGSIRVNKYESDRLLRGAMKESGSRTAGKKSGRLHTLKEDITVAIESQRLPEIIVPQFDLSAADLTSSKPIVFISNGSCGYDTPVLENINIRIGATEHVALTGDNGSGKSTLAKAIMNMSPVKRSGSWETPTKTKIGYLDQHYSSLESSGTVLQTIEKVVTGWTNNEIRRHLNDFLFRKNEEVLATVSTLSGGEKVRLSLALIAAQNPQLLILDEITNNLDLETRQHVIEVLKAYPGALLIISHDQDFLDQIRIDTTYELVNKTVVLK